MEGLFRRPERLSPVSPHETSHLLFPDPQQERSEASGLQPQLAAELAEAPTLLRGDAVPCHPESRYRPQRSLQRRLLRHFTDGLRLLVFGSK